MRRRIPKRMFLTVTALVSVLALAACGGGEDPTPTEPSGGGGDPTPTEAGSDPTPTEGGGTEPTPTEAGRDFEEYFDGQTVTIEVGFSPGGGYDTSARLFARHAQKYIPGEVDFQVRNDAGAGGQFSLQAGMRAEPDGYTIAILHPRFVKREIVGTDVPDFDPQAVNFLGAPTAAPNINLTCTRENVASSWQDVLDQGITLQDGTVQPGESKGLGSFFVSLVGGPIDMTSGYGGTSDIMLSFDSGELTATNRCTPEEVPRLYPEWMEEGNLVPLFWYDRDPAEAGWLDEIQWDGPEVANVTELPGLDLTDEQIRVFEAALAVDRNSRALILSPDVPEDIVTFWQDVYVQVVEDEEFIADMNDAGYAVGLATGNAIRDAMAQAQGLSPEGQELFGELAGAE